MKYTNHMKATVWNSTMKMESFGTPDAVIDSAFWMISGHDRREKLLKQLQESHERMSKVESVNNREVTPSIVPNEVKL